ncbi:MAG TPA: FAD-dependent oxidoreductase [Tepidisphaeraceae bacterium]|nr:FAD-dependent oxidoreductase [Tepidisphaeraceae bacterium]
MKNHRAILWAAMLCLTSGGFAAENPPAPSPTNGPVLIEAESFKDPGGWVLDTQFVNIMGSPYLMAHGLGVPVKDATSTVTFPSTGVYTVFVRTKDWVAQWKAPGTPGRFQLLVDGKPLATTFGTEGADWHWQAGGEVQIDKTNETLALHDLTGFEGRCDAICFSKDPAFVPPNEPKALAAWRNKTLGLPDKPVEAGPFDLVVIGGGYAGMGAAISGARMGCKVALIQDRPVLGGNGSSEVRVWSQGGTTMGKYPKLGEIVEEFADSAKDSPGTAKEFGDEKKEAIVREEPNIELYLNNQAFAVEMKDGKIAAVISHDMRTSAETRFTGKLFADTTGHGTIGALAGADFDELEKGHMGMSNMWRWDDEKSPQPFPQVPWALPLKMADFPYPNRGKAEWFWEGGFNRDPIKDLEYIRDWNFRAICGAFNAMKNGDGKAKHANAKLEWIAYIGGNRESRLLRGDLVLTRDDIINKKEFDDGCVPSTWSIDLHEPKEQYAKKFPDDPFISKAVFDSRVDKKNGYPIPYRCFYSRNITNLFMAGRDISVDHGALGTVRVMRTCGMEGEVVGKAASICAKDQCLPRDVYYSHLDELKQLMNLPGQARRATLKDAIDPNAPLPDIASHRAARRLPGGGETTTFTGVDPKTLIGLIVDTDQVKLTGEWKPGTGLRGFIGKNYLYASDGPAEKSARFEFTVPASGEYEVRFAVAPHPNRATNVSATVISKDGEKTVAVDERAAPPLGNGFVSLGKFKFGAGTAGAVVVSAKGANGIVSVNAVQVLPVK